MDAERREFEATIAAAGRGGAYVPAPAEVVTALGGRGRIPYVNWFEEAKRPGTRQRRIETVERVRPT